MALSWARAAGVPAAARWLPWALIAAGWFATIQVRPMLDPDEGRYAEIPREMLAHGDFVTPRFNDLKYFEKPPLQYWATAVVYAVSGLSEWSSRIWAVGLAFACLPLVYAWVRRGYGYDAALAAVAALGVSPYFLTIGHLNLLDPAFTFWLTAAVLAFTVALSEPPGSAAERRWMLCAWALAALAVLSKGIVVGVLAVGSLVLYTVIERDLRPWRRLHVGAGLAVLLADRSLKSPPTCAAKKATWPTCRPWRAGSSACAIGTVRQQRRRKASCQTVPLPAAGCRCRRLCLAVH